MGRKVASIKQQNNTFFFNVIRHTDDVVCHRTGFINKLLFRFGHTIDIIEEDPLFGW